MVLRRDDEGHLHAQTPSSEIRVSELCQMKCKGTDRPVWDTPAYYAHGPSGEKVLVCKCCTVVLYPVVPTEANPARGLAIAPNISMAVAREGEQRYECRNCGYDVVSLKELKPAT